MLKKKLCLLLAAAPLCAMTAQELKVVAGASDTTTASTLNLRGVGPAGGQISVQGESFPIYSSGEWAARVNLTLGDNTITLTASDGQSVTRRIHLKNRPEPRPIEEPRAENVQLLPGADMALACGETVRIRLNPNK